MTVKQRLILLVSAGSAGLIFLAIMGAVQMNRVFTAANYGNANSVPSLLTLEEAFRPMAAARPIIWQYFYATPAERPVLEARIFALQEDVDKGVLDPTTGDTYISQLQHQWDAADRAFQTYQRDLAGWRSGKYVSTDRAMQYMGMGTAGLDALTNPLGFMTSDTMAAAAPQVYAVGQALTALQKVGELGASGVRDQLTGLTDDLSAGIRDLPSILADVLPDVFEKGIPSIVEALVEAAPEIALASVKAQVSLVEMLLSDLPQAVGAGMWDALEKFWGELKDFLQHPGQSLTGAAWGARAVAVDAARILAGLATFGASEVAYGAVNKASGGKLHDALYGDDSSRARSAREASWGGRPSRDLEDQRAFMQLNRGLNQFDRRENATSATGVRYFASGPTRI